MMMFISGRLSSYDVDDEDNVPNEHSPAMIYDPMKWHILNITTYVHCLILSHDINKNRHQRNKYLH